MTSRHKREAGAPTSIPMGNFRSKALLLTALSSELLVNHAQTVDHDTASSSC